MKQWNQSHPGWIRSVKLRCDVRIEEISRDTTLYFRHVATVPTAKAGSGAKLSWELIKDAENEGVENVVGEILYRFQKVS